MADANAAENKEHGLFGTFEKRDDGKLEQRIQQKQQQQQQSHPVDPRPGRAPAYNGQGEGGNKQAGGITDKIKEKLPGHQGEKVTKEEPEKKGMMEKVKEKLPGRKEG